MAKRPRVFVSYSHDSDAHRERVLALSERLRRDGIETMLDQYADPAQRFTLKKQIEEAETKLRELS